MFSAVQKAAANCPTGSFGIGLRTRDKPLLLSTEAGKFNFLLARVTLARMAEHIAGHMATPRMPLLLTRTTTGMRHRIRTEGWTLLLPTEASVSWTHPCKVGIAVGTGPMNRIIAELAHVAFPRALLVLLTEVHLDDPAFNTAKVVRLCAPFAVPYF